MARRCPRSPTRPGPATSDGPPIPRKNGTAAFLRHERPGSLTLLPSRCYLCAGISRSVAMKLTGHKTEVVYRRYAIVAENDLPEAGAKLAASLETGTATTSLGDNLGDISGTVRNGRPLNA